MGKKDNLKQRCNDYVSDWDDQEYYALLIELNNQIFNELLCVKNEVSFDGIIAKELTNDGMKFRYIIQINCIEWFVTADRLMINNRRIYSFRFANPCHPDFYESFVPYYHSFFMRISGTRHGLNGWYQYVGDRLPEMIQKYFKISKVTNATKSYRPTIFVNEKCERLDIELDFKSDEGYERVAILFERAAPATAAQLMMYRSKPTYL